MDSSLILWVTLALCVFWGVGVYNRLMRERARGLRALGSVQKHMRLYADLVRDDVAKGAASHTQSAGVDHSRGDWALLLAALQEFEVALKDFKPNAFRNEPLERLGLAYDSLQVVWRAVDSAPPDLAGPIVPAALQSQWGITTQRVETARCGFNQIVTQYNDALTQFPARLIVGVMGFKPGCML
jgi:LemA protein